MSKIPSKKTANKIRFIIDKYMTYLKFVTLGPSALTKKQLVSLVKEGLVKKDEENKTIPETYLDSHSAFLDVSSRKQVRDHSIKHIQSSAGKYVDKFINKARTDLTQMAENNLFELKRKAIAGTLESNIGKKTSKNIARELREKTQDLSKDWERVVTTELAQAANMGAMDAIVENNKDKSPDEIYVYKEGPRDHKTCLEVTEKVKTKRGMVPVANLVVGDKVATLKDSNLKQRGRKNSAFITFLEEKDSEILEIELEDGRVLKCSPEHPTLVKYKDLYLYVPAKDLYTLDVDVVNINSLSSKEKKGASNMLNMSPLKDQWAFEQKWGSMLTEMCHDQAMSIKKIAKYFQISRRYVIYRIEMYKIDRSQVATIRTRKVNHSRKGEIRRLLSDREIESAKKLYKSGLTLRDVAVISGCCVNTLRRNLQKEIKEGLAERRSRGGRAAQAKIKSWPLHKQQLYWRKIVEKARYTMFKNGTAPASASQLELFKIMDSAGLNVKLNKSVSRCSLDIELNIRGHNFDIEYDGSGHFLPVKLGLERVSKMKQKDFARDLFLKKEGYKILRIKAPNDEVPPIEAVMGAIYYMIDNNKNFQELICQK